MSRDISEQELRERAYALWEARGRPEGSATDDWALAEIELKAERDAAASPLEPLARKAVRVLERQTESRPTAEIWPVSSKTARRTSSTRE